MKSFNKPNNTNNENPAEAKLNGRWTKEQHIRFLEGLRLHGKNWKKIQTIVTSRTGSQIRSHAQKFFNKLQRKYQNLQYTDSKDFEDSTPLNNRKIQFSSPLLQSGLFYFGESANIEQEYSLTQKAIFLREKHRSRANRHPSAIGELDNEEESLQQKSKQILTSVESLPQPRMAGNCRVYSDIWKYPYEMMETNFLSTFVDLRPKRNSDQLQQRKSNARKQSFVSCEGEEQEYEDMTKPEYRTGFPRMESRQ